MLRLLSTFLLLATVVWILVANWRRRRNLQPRWPRWLIYWALWVLGGWAAMITQVWLRFHSLE